MEEKIYFDHITEKTDTYFLKYSPPDGSISFASLTVTYVSDVADEVVATDLEKLAGKWITRYPVPVMVSAFDRHGDLINLENVRPISQVTAILDEGKPRCRWEILEGEEFSEELKSQRYLIEIYSDLNYRTQSEVSAKVRENLKPILAGKRLLIIWSVVVPIAIALLEFFSPVWISVIALLYSFWKAYQQWLKMTGRKKKSDREIEREKDASLKEHHHYHCKLNPGGFLRLKIENFQKMEEEQIQKEYDSISTSD